MATKPSANCTNDYNTAAFDSDEDVKERWYMPAVKFEQIMKTY